MMHLSIRPNAYTGKILSNENQLSSYNIKDSDFLVLMISKVRDLALITSIDSDHHIAESRSSRCTLNIGCKGARADACSRSGPGDPSSSTRYAGCCSRRAFACSCGCSG